jgi:hypothetical protein
MQIGELGVEQGCTYHYTHCSKTTENWGTSDRTNVALFHPIFGHDMESMDLLKLMVGNIEQAYSNPL